MVDEQKIGIVLLGTNSYVVLLVRFVKRFMQFYKGNRKIKFFLFTENDLKDYLPESIDYEYIPTKNRNWVEGTNLKFKSILSLYSIYQIPLGECSHIFYFDADSNISKEFTEEWFLGDSVAGQHYGDQTHMLVEGRPFERNPRSKAYIPINTSLPEVYTYGAFWGGSVEWIYNFCKKMIEWQIADKSWGYEPGVNDESFSNCYFHYNPPAKLVLTSQFMFDISDKGGIGNPRHMNLDVSKIKEDLLLYRNNNINIQNGKVICEN